MTGEAVAAAKARGAFRYLADAPPAGTLHAAVLRSPHPHARIRAVDLSAARALEGVRLVLDRRDVPQGFRTGLRIEDQPVLAAGVVRFRGEAVAAIAAETPAIARRALSLIAVDYEPLPVVGNPLDALSPGAPLLHSVSNLCHRFDYRRGESEGAFAACAHEVRVEMETPRQMHAALELEGGIAWREGEALTIRAPSQDPHYVARACARLLGIADERVRVVGSPIGGGFGGKEDLHVQPILALLAWRAGAPVRLVMSRPESVAAGYKRHPFRVSIRLGCDARGAILALKAEVLADTGAYASHGLEVLDTAMECLQGAYRIAHVELKGRLAYTNNGISGAFRGFGAVQTQSVMEAAVDALADKAGIDRLAFRRCNLAGPDDPGPLGQDMVRHPELGWVAEALSGLPPVATPGGPRVMTGVGTVLVRKGEGFSAEGPNGAHGILRLDPDGRLTLVSSLTDMGQGIEAGARAALSRILGVSADEVRFEAGDTRLGADSGPTSASRGTQVVLGLVRAGAEPLREKVRLAAGDLLGLGSDRLETGPGGVYQRVPRGNRPLLTWRDLAERGSPIAVPVRIEGLTARGGHPASHHLFTVCGARAVVEVDRWTGMVRCRRLDIVPACGPPLLPAVFDGQMTGGAVQALGFCLTEDLPAREGVFAADNLDGYFVPTFADAPQMNILPVSKLDPNDPVGFRGTGEIALNAVAPAIVCAVRDVLGAAPPRLPVPAGWVLERIGKKTITSVNMHCRY